MSYRTAGTKHEVAYQDIVDLLRRHGDITSEEMLAVAANMIGKLIAVQDQRTMTRERAFEIITKNIELGNQQALELLKSGGDTGAKH